MNSYFQSTFYFSPFADLITLRPNNKSLTSEFITKAFTFRKTNCRVACRLAITSLLRHSSGLFKSISIPRVSLPLKWCWMLFFSSKMIFFYKEIANLNVVLASKGSSPQFPEHYLIKSPISQTFFSIKYLCNQLSAKTILMFSCKCIHNAYAICITFWKN